MLLCKHRSVFYKKNKVYSGLIIPQEIVTLHFWQRYCMKLYWFAKTRENNNKKLVVFNNIFGCSFIVFNCFTVDS